ncbi:hypothetical protein HY837_01245 [archaeon]|nr:hypothetical protein [archaeon]
MIAGIDFGSTLTKIVWKTDKLNFASTADQTLEEIFELLIKDKLPEKEGTLQGELVIANFGKAKVDSKKEDLYATLLSTIAITVTREVLIREMIDKFPKTSQNIVYVGSLVSSSLKLREELTKYTHMIGRTAHFPEKGEFSLALGVYLNNSEEVKND